MADVSAKVMMKETGISYRQLLYWTRQGAIPTTSQPKFGSGYPRKYNSNHIPQIRVMVIISRSLKGQVELSILKKVFDNFDHGMLVLSESPLVTLEWPTY